MEIDEIGSGEREKMPESLRPIKAEEEDEVEDDEEEEEEEEEEEDVCRICRNNGDDGNPLHYPCACSGSIKYVHQDCLLQWLTHSNARQCEVCKHAFSFSPVYADNAPTRLPFREFLFGIAMKAFRSLHFILRLGFVISVWFLIIPFTTFWIWRLAFIRSFMEAQTLLLNHMSFSQLAADCFNGVLLSAGIVFIFLGVTSLRDYFRHLRELRGQDAEREDEVMDRQQGLRAARRLPAHGNRVHIDAGNDEVVQDVAGVGNLQRRNPDNAAARLDIHAAGLEADAARLEAQVARLEARVEQIFDGVDDGDGAEDVPFDELVGMQGPVFHLIENAITVLASNAIFLGVVIFLPFTLGRLLLYMPSKFLMSTTNVSAITGLSSSSDLDVASVTLNNNTNISMTEVRNLQSHTLVDNITTNMMQQNETEFLSKQASSLEMLTVSGIASLQLSDVATLAVGYMVICGLLFCYFALIALVRYNRGEPLTEGRIYGIASMAEAIPSLARQFLAGVKYILTMLKVAFLLVIELGVFPLLCGWWLDVCTISMLGTTISQRVTFFWSSKVTSSLLHWFVGILYMLQISIFVSLLRGVLRPGVLYFLRDPADPNYNPFRDLIDDPIHKHARRVLLSVVVYGSLIVMLVFLPVKVAMYLAPSVFPLDTSVSDPFTEIPADMLLFQICIPFAIEHFRPRATIKKILLHWFTLVGWALGLTDFLLPSPEENEEQTGVPAHGQQELNQNRPAFLLDINRVPQEDSSSNTSNNQDFEVDDTADSEEYLFVLRIVVLLFLAWLTLLSFNSALVVIPVSLGRALFSAVPRLPITHGIKCNDLYAFNIGCYAIWAAIAGVSYAAEYLKSHDMKYLLVQGLKWSGIIIKSSVLLSLWIFAIPVLIGLLFELLVVVPLRVPVDESPVFLLYQDWAFGLIFLKIWTRLVMLGQLAPLVDESWRIKFDQVRADGFSRLRGLWVFQEIVAPILMKLLTVLCVPYVFARGLFPIFGYSLIINSAVYRFAWLGCLTLGLLWHCMKRFQLWFMNLHNSIRDDRYLIGRRLHNYGEDSSAQLENKKYLKLLEEELETQTAHPENESGSFSEQADNIGEQSVHDDLHTTGRERNENLRHRTPRSELFD